MPGTRELISFGAGVNSVAMTIVLVNDGWRGPIVFADTGAEWPETYCYMRYFDHTWLRPRGLAIEWLHPRDRTDETGIGLHDYCTHYGIIPLLAVRWCSVKWKRNPVLAAFPGHVRCLGFSAEEHRRVKNAPMERYPLYEQDITRRECQRIIQRAGLEIPTKSGCWFCPGQALADWRRLYYNHPDLYERAAQLEDMASVRHSKNATLDPHGISLREHARRRWRGQMTMDLSRWLPCICSV